MLQGYSNATPNSKGDETMRYKGITVRQRKDSNTWYARWITNGKEHRISGKTQKEVYKKLKSSLQPQIEYKITFNSWIDKWFELYQQNNRESTKQMFIQTRKKYFTTNLFKKDITQVSTLELQEFINSFTTPRMKKRIYQYVRNIVNKAYRNEIIPKDISINLVVPQYKADEKHALTRDEEKLFLKSAIQNDGVIFVIQLLEGLRPGEGLALEWEDINFKDKTITINKSITRDESDTLTKNKSSNRIIPLFKQTEELILPFKSNGRIFKYKNNAKRKLFNRILKNADLSNISEHELRHTFITRCAEKNIAEHIIQKWVGHQIGSSVTKSVYTHASIESEKESITLFESQKEY